MPGASLARVTRSLPCRQTHTIVHKVTVRAANVFSLNCLRSRSLSRRHYSLAFAQFKCLLKYTSAWIFHCREMFECAHLKFTVSGRSKPTNKHTHTRAQCSHACSGSPQLCLDDGEVELLSCTKKETEKAIRSVLRYQHCCTYWTYR